MVKHFYMFMGHLCFFFYEIVLFMLFLFYL